jgi:hypothetical protein
VPSRKSRSGRPIRAVLGWSEGRLRTRFMVRHGGEVA